MFVIFFLDYEFIFKAILFYFEVVLLFFDNYAFSLFNDVNVISNVKFLMEGEKQNLYAEIKYVLISYQLAFFY